MYLGKLYDDGPAVLGKQRVPLEFELWRRENYEEFLEEEDSPSLTVEPTILALDTQ